ncbi:MAG: hypothetical protein JWQ02_549 [Capsulimonas sp.]|nr:hypothetical protein [Capsulimonas sp.]
MLNHNKKAASVVVGVQTLACILAAGYVLTHFHHQADADIPVSASAYSGAMPHSLHSASDHSSPRLFIVPPNGQYQDPRIVIRRGAIMAPMTDTGYIAHGSQLQIGDWRIVDTQGRHVASGKVPSDGNYTSFDSGFTVRNTHQITMLSNLPTVVLSVQADASAFKLAGRQYFLEQADEGRPTHSRFYLAAPPAH